MAGPIRVLVVDDSAVIRRVLTTAFRTDPDFEVAGEAGDPYEARDLIVTVRPDVMTLDLHMPRMDGTNFLRKLKTQFPVPTVVVSGRAAKGSNVEREAVEAGAYAVVQKPSTGRVQDMLLELKNAVRSAAGRAPAGNLSARVRGSMEGGAPRPAPSRARGRRVEAIIIGASTGGPPAVLQVLRALGPDAPPVLIAQHMPSHFTGPFAERMNKTTALTCQEATDGAPLRVGHVYLAPGDFHLRVQRRAGRLVCQVTQDDLVQGHRPSVDVLMASAAQVLGAGALGVILTGMGRDGADGLLAMRRAGAWTVAQDEKSCVVYGMPKAAVEQHAASSVLPVEGIGPAVRDRASTKAMAS